MSHHDRGRPFFTQMFHHSDDNYLTVVGVESAGTRLPVNPQSQFNMATFCTPLFIVAPWQIAGLHGYNHAGDVVTGSLGDAPHLA